MAFYLRKIIPLESFVTKWLEKPRKKEKKNASKRASILKQSLGSFHVNVFFLRTGFREIASLGVKLYSWKTKIHKKAPNVEEWAERCLEYVYPWHAYIRFFFFPKTSQVYSTDERRPGLFYFSKATCKEKKIRPWELGLRMSTIPSI